MPYYDFYCEKCGHEFEELLGINDDRSKIKCPECRSSEIQRNFGSISMGVRKGGGSSSCTSCTDHHCGSCSG